MNRIIYILISSAILTSSILPQERDSLIQLYSGMGDTLDFIDREIFDLYQDIDGYKYAQLFKRNEEFLVSKITCLKNGILSDTLLINDFHQLYLLRQTLSRFLLENEEKLDSPLDATLFTKSGNKFDGKLEIFSKRFLFLNSDMDYLTGRTIPFKFKTQASNVDSLVFLVKKNMLPYVGGGALVGFLGGFLIGTATAKTDWPFKKEVTWFITGGIGLATGALIGWLIGESLPPDILTIKFNSPYDVTKLKDYSAYYFQYDKTLEEKYVELE